MCVCVWPRSWKVNTVQVFRRTACEQGHWFWPNIWTLNSVPKQYQKNLRSRWKIKREIIAQVVDQEQRKTWLFRDKRLVIVFASSGVTWEQNSEVFSGKVHSVWGWKRQVWQNQSSESRLSASFYVTVVICYDFVPQKQLDTELSVFNFGMFIQHNSCGERPNLWLDKWILHHCNPP
jgi:hypothetical protein